MAWSKTEIVAATGGEIVRAGRQARFGEVVTDSTKVKKGSVFIALKGERHDGHRFVREAARRGARCVVVDRDLPHSGLAGTTVVRVDDTLRALGDLARYRRDRLAPKVLAITGSNGKTTTKEMVAAVLEEGSLGAARLRGRVLKTEGNFNNLVGLPLTLLRLRGRHKVAVVELGTNRPGEIRRLAEIADPDAGLITSVAAAHLEGLSSLAGVAREKGALYRGVRPDGAIAVNVDDPRVKKLAQSYPGKKVTFGKRGRVRAGAVRIHSGRGTLFTLHAGKLRRRVRLNFLGEHNISNALGAAALTLGAGIGFGAVCRGLEKAKPFPMRMQIEEWRGVAIINDAYNANPASMRAALETLKQAPCRGRRVAVLGDMFELGRHGAREHLLLGQAAARSSLDRLCLLGAQAAAVQRGALAAGMTPAEIIIGTDHEDLGRRLRAWINPGDWLLFKGSRGMKMERVLEALRRGRD